MQEEDFYDELVDFGIVFCGTRPARVVKIKNQSTIDQNYTVEKYTYRPSLDTGFSVKPAQSPPVKPNQEFSFTVEFVPNTVDVRSCDSFLIKHLFGIHCVITTKAEVKGPECSISCSRVRLVCPNDKRKVSKQIDLRNDGQCNAEFQFPVDGHPLISVQPRHGTISPSKSVHIIITYTPTNNKIYFKRIFCLISNKEPLILNVHAVWMKSNEDFKPNVVKNNLPTYVSGYHCFFYDVMTHIPKEEAPLVSLDTYYIDFGHCQPKNNKIVEFSVTNNSNQVLSLVWHRGVFTKELQIKPTEAEIEVNNSSTFTAIFNPLIRDRLFGCVLEAQLYCGEGLVPFPLEINLKGDSFEELSCGWGAQYKVEPTSLVLPPCVPSPFCPSHATLTIHRKGPLPLAFRFNPPPLTNFYVKPQQGVIHGSFQIVVVQYQPQTLNEALDTERWLLTFNSNEIVNQCTVKFGCSIETPHVIINNGKDVRLPAVHPGSEYSTDINICNPTRFSFWFSPEILGVDVEGVLSMAGARELWPHEHCRLSLVFRPRGVGKLEAQISCSPMLGDEVEGRSTYVHVIASSCETRLTVNPEKLFLKKVIRDFEHKRGFKVSNSGDAVIRGCFTWGPEEDCGLEDFDISFNPQTFSLNPGKSLEVEVSITPFTTGERNLVIKYLAGSSCELPLLPVLVDSVFPTLKITNIRLANSTPFFTKMHYWKMMQMNRLNLVLSNLRPKETPEVEMNVPSFVSTSRPSFVEILVENTSELSSNVTIRPIVTCSCPPVKKQTSFSVSKWDHNCPHRNQVELGPAAVYVQAGGYAILKMEISYRSVGLVESHFLLNFVPEDYEEIVCSIKLRVYRISIPNLSDFLDTTEPKENEDFVFNMRSVYIGDVKPYAQGFQLYNNTKKYANFEVDDSELNGTPFKYIGETDQIPPVAMHQLLFTFFPYSCTTYQAEVTLLINNKHQKLILRGRGVGDPREINESDEYFPKTDRLNEISPGDVFLSTSHTSLGPTKPESTLNNVFFINNTTKSIVSFLFLSTKVQDVLEIRVTPVKGLVPPGGCVQCRLSCHCCGWPAWLDVTLACAYADFSQYAANVHAINRYYEHLVANHSNFTFTENGLQTGNVTPPTEKWPIKNYLTIGVAVDVRDNCVRDCDDVLPVCPPVMEPQRDSKSQISEDIKFLIVDVLERILWEVLDECYRPAQSANDSLAVRYQQITNLDIQSEMRVPNSLSQNVLADVLHTAWQDVFHLDGNRSCELMRRRLIVQTTPDSRITSLVGRSSSGIPTVISISDIISLWSERLRSSSKNCYSS